MMYPIFKILCITQITLASFLATHKEEKVIVEEKYSLTIQVEGIFYKKGILYAAVYNSKEDFMITPYLTKKVAIKEFSDQLVFENLEPGDYAITIYQDLNENGKLDKMFAVPIEPYGLSNNKASYPKFEILKVEVNQDETIKINIKN